LVGYYYYLYIQKTRIQTNHTAFNPVFSEVSKTLLSKNTCCARLSTKEKEGNRVKFTVDQGALTDGVNWVSRSLSTRPIKTELLGIVIDATGDEVILSGSDLETSSKSFFKADIAQPGKVLVPGKLLAEISRSLPNKPITITLRWFSRSCYFRFSKVHTANSFNL
jgi:hypothetical protein